MVHTFKCAGECFALDVESGSLFVIDALTKKIIDKKSSPYEFSQGDFFGVSEQTYLQALAEVNSLINEGVLFSEATTPNKIHDGTPIKSMCLNISHRCNLRCGYCFAEGGSYNTKAIDMPFEVARAAIDLLIEKSAARKTLEVDFFGGEPLLNLDVVKQTVSYAKQRAAACGKSFRFTITTNALNLTDEVTDFFNSEMYNVVVSIDGRESVHNHVRKTVGGKDSYQTIIKNAQKFAKKRGERQYYIRGTFTSQNTDFSLDVLSLYEKGFKSLSLEPVVLPPSHPLAIKKEHLNKLFSQYEELAKLYVKMRSQNEWFSFFHFMLDMEGGPCQTKRIRSCGAGCEYIAVDPSGDIYPCHQFVGNNKYKMGNVSQNNLASSLSSQFEQNTIFNKPHCMDCWAKYYCSGGCAANSANLHKSIDAKEEIACELMKKRTECALYVYAKENFEKDC